MEGAAGREASGRKLADGAGSHSRVSLPTSTSVCERNCKSSVKV